jgi:alpha-beta hydrolase superfamily lysophospholipase
LIAGCFFYFPAGIFIYFARCSKYKVHSKVMDSFKIETPDHVRVHVYAWLPQNKPVAVLQIAHGMQEHALRYAHFAGWLNSRNIAVYANDHIGHGGNARTPDEISHFPRKDDWQRSVDILDLLTQKIKLDHPDVPVILLGHSMGSVLVQSFMIRYGKNAYGYILSGAIRQPAFMAFMGTAIAGMLSWLFGPDDRSRLIIYLGYGQYNKHFRPNRTKSDWLCRDNSIVDEYISSPLCGIPLTNRFYVNFFHGFSFIACRRNLAQIPAGKPVLVIAGKSDPAGFFGKAPAKIDNLLTKHAKAKVQLNLYPECRHEILNETNREEVYQDVMEWILKMLNFEC